MKRIRRGSLITLCVLLGMALVGMMLFLCAGPGFLYGETGWQRAIGKAA